MLLSPDTGNGGKSDTTDVVVVKSGPGYHRCCQRRQPHSFFDGGKSKGGCSRIVSRADA